MKNLNSLPRRIFTTACVLTGTTELAARRLGASFFLPALFIRRYSEMGGLDPAHFAMQMDGVRSFTDDAWCGYWDAIAEEQLLAAERAVPGISGKLAPDASASPNGGRGQAMATLREALAPLGSTIADMLTLDTHTGLELEVSGAATSAQIYRAVTGLRHLVKAITYYQVSAFPGGSPARMESYHTSRSLFDQLLEIIGPLLGMSIERHQIVADGVQVDGYLVLPAGTNPCPAVITTNGLEGTVQELLIPLLRYHDSGLAVFVMEMPGTYAYRSPMSGDAEKIYHKVIDSIAAHPRIDANRIGFVGVSFGGYWAARMAATSSRLRCVVANGAPTHRSFQMAASLGMPEIIVRALSNTTGASSLMDLGQKLRGLSLRDRYQEIKMPLLVINGDTDTLISTQDSVDLAAGAQQATLVLYPDDDHCAMGHYSEWMDMSQEWLGQHLLGTAAEASRS